MVPKYHHKCPYNTYAEGGSTQIHREDVQKRRIPGDHGSKDRSNAHTIQENGATRGERGKERYPPRVFGGNAVLLAT